MGSAADRMKAMGDKLQERTKESYERKDEYGTSFGYFKRGGTVKMSSGQTVEMKDISVWRPKQGIHVFDIIPTFAGGQWPQDSHGIKLPEGEPVYVLDIWVHTNVGPNDQQFICLNRNYGLPCPICEHQVELKKAIDYDQDLVKSLYPKRRNVYNIVCFDNAEEEDKGVQIFECSQFYMEAKLTPLAFDARTKAMIPYPHFSKGKSVQFEIKPKSFNIGDKQIKGTDYVGHKLLDRDYVVSDQDLDEAFVLDDIICIPTYEEVFKAYWAGIKDLPEKQEQPGGGSRRRRAETTQEPAKQEETPPLTGRRVRQTSEPIDKKETSFDAVGCKQGGKWGEDIDHLEGCNTCADYDKCAQRAEELKEKMVSNPIVGQTVALDSGRKRRRPGGA